MRILVADRFSEQGIRRLLGAGFAVDVKPSIGRAEALGIIHRYDGLIVRSGTQVDCELVEKASNLKIIARAGKGTDNIDVKAAMHANVLVVYAAGGNEDAVAEHVVNSLFTLFRKLPEVYSSFRKGEWVKTEYVGSEIAGKTLGVIGLGGVGRRVAARANALGMKILGHDPCVVAPESHCGDTPVSYVGLEALLAGSDAVTLHVPKTPETLKLLDAEKLGTMKKGAYIINTSRGGIVDEKALYTAMESGRIAGAAFDVFEEEPPQTPYSPLYQHPSFWGTCHIAGKTVEAEARVGDAVAGAVISYLKEGVISRAVDAVHFIEKEQFFRLKPHREVAKRLVAFLSQWKGTCRAVSMQFGGAFLPEERRVLEDIILREVLSADRVRKAGAVGYLNARIVAEEEGFAWQSTALSREHNRIRLIWHGRSADMLIEGLADEEERGVFRYVVKAVDDFAPLDFELDGDMLVYKNSDEPCVTAKVAAMLCEQGLNIDSQVTVQNDEGKALTVMNVSRGYIGEDLIKQICSLTHVNEASKVRI